MAQKLLEVQKVTGHITYEMLTWYSMQNADRLFLVRAQARMVMSKGFSLGGRVALLESKMVKVGRKRLTIATPEDAKVKKQLNKLLKAKAEKGGRKKRSLGKRSAVQSKAIKSRAKSTRGRLAKRK